jgi:hypothetical protein
LEKFLITHTSGNRITGPIMVTTSPRGTCPLVCPFRKSGDGPEAGLCYAEHGHLGHYIWNGLDKTKAGDLISGRIRVYGFNDLLAEIRALPEDTLWRHNQAGDLPSNDQKTIAKKRLQRLIRANKGRRGFTYTHFDVVKNKANHQAIADANRNGFTINLSADTMEEADELVDTKCGPVTVVVPTMQMTNTRTPAGRKVVICPARVRPDMTCATCGICATQRKAIIAFPALGSKKGLKV